MRRNGIPGQLRELTESLHKINAHETLNVYVMPFNGRARRTKPSDRPVTREEILRATQNNFEEFFAIWSEHMDQHE
jgi:hypothetical protein